MASGRQLQPLHWSIDCWTALLAPPLHMPLRPRSTGLEVLLFCIVAHLDRPPVWLCSAVASNALGHK